MEIKILNKKCIITPLTKFLDARECRRLAEEIESIHDFVVGLDLSMVEDCTLDFFDTIKRFSNLAIFNLQSDVFALINIMNYDKILNLYTTEEDFLYNRHRLLKRNLKII